MKKFCYACAAPLELPANIGGAEHYCKSCVDENNKPLSREKIQQGVAGWFQEWQPGITEDQALKRADLYLSAMPEWADD